MCAVIALCYLSVSVVSVRFVTSLVSVRCVTSAVSVGCVVRLHPAVVVLFKRSAVLISCVSVEHLKPAAPWRRRLAPPWENIKHQSLF